MKQVNKSGTSKVASDVTIGVKELDADRWRGSAAWPPGMVVGPASFPLLLWLSPGCVVCSFGLLD